ncbi:hypothetical protein J2Z79_002407 [Symbiobacterium terraclitae]|uniref:Lipoprotein n=1 Tax=Symbiobacterium terraclitae TaxID=557451 RepID=A0ABS4JVR3_9FIRM|nr:hypothetical protein [Symbiobacterium terraclitae]MBP2018991.1 hypothetical protein [Symbiobacterium terraclitae]
MRVVLTALLGAAVLISGCAQSDPGGSVRVIGSPPGSGQAGRNKGDVEPSPPPPEAPRGPVTSPEQAIGLLPSTRAQMTFDAILVEDYVPPHLRDSQGEGPQRSTWVVQSLHPWPDVTFFVDADTGEVYAVRESEGTAPVKLPKSTQDAVDLVFHSWGDLPDIAQFPTTVGTEDGEIYLPGDPDGASIPATFSVESTASQRGEYVVTFTLQWRADEQLKRAVWVFEVHPEGGVSAPTRDGDEPPATP